MATKTLDQHIVDTPGVAGGRARIAGRPITVHSMVVWHERMGQSADEIATEHDLSLSDVYTALAYYSDHRGEIDRETEEGSAASDVPVYIAVPPVSKWPWCTCGCYLLNC